MGFKWYSRKENIPGGVSPMRLDEESSWEEKVEKGREKALNYISSDIYREKLMKNNNYTEKEANEVIQARIKAVTDAKILKSNDPNSPGYNDGETGNYAYQGNVYLTDDFDMSTLHHEIGHVAGGSFLEGAQGKIKTLSTEDTKTIGTGNIRKDKFFESGTTSYLIGEDEMFSTSTNYITGQINPKTGLMDAGDWGWITPSEISEDGLTGKAVHPGGSSRHRTYEPEGYAQMFELQLNLRELGILGENEYITKEHLEEYDKVSEGQGSAIYRQLKNMYGKELESKLNTVADATQKKVNGGVGTINNGMFAGATDTST